MGLLTEGSPLSWEETKALADHVRKHGILQFINLYNKLKDRTNDVLKWGDEVEYNLVRFDHENKRVQLLLKAGELLDILQQEEKNNPGNNRTTWRPEFTAYMIEGTPGGPYGHTMAHFNMVEANMKLRRQEVNKLLGPGETALSLTAFPRLGCPNFTYPVTEPSPESRASRSLFFPDEVIFGGHPRFNNLYRNVRHRRGEKVAINIPIYKDIHTPSPFVEDLSLHGDSDGSSQRAAKPDHIYMDCMAFGMGCSCLQMTFQACNIQEARHLYDQLTPLCPILLALSAACPIQRGYLADTDCRWNTLAAASDCRTKQERGEEPLTDDRFVIPKSRYDSIDCYLSPSGEKYNDIEVVKDEQIYNQLCDAGIDSLLSQHIAHLFIRDTVSLLREKVHQNDETDSDHFENIQSTNYQTMRFKPPPPESPIGWRVEFRPTEVQITDFENAAYSCFIVLLTRVILTFNLNFLIPISKVDENMAQCQKRDAVLNQKFWFRKDVLNCNQSHSSCTCSTTETSQTQTNVCKCNQLQDEYTKMTADEIINGKPGMFPGLIPLIQQYLSSADDLDVDTSCTIQQYLRLIQDRAAGKLKTAACWMRDFVLNHPSYKQDSVVTDEITYDLIDLCKHVTNGKASAPELLPAYSTKSVDSLPTAMQKIQAYHQSRLDVRSDSLASLSSSFLQP